MKKSNRRASSALFLAICILSCFGCGNNRPPQGGFQPPQIPGGFQPPQIPGGQNPPQTLMPPIDTSGGFQPPQTPGFQPPQTQDGGQPPATGTETIPPLEAGAAPQFVQWPAVQGTPRTNYGAMYDDVWAHDASAKWYGSPGSTAHEGTHGVNAALSNKYFGNSYQENGWGLNGNEGYYVGFNRGVIIQKPRLPLNAVVEFVPASHKVSRYLHYITGGWNAKPTHLAYVFDEWVAYANGAQASIEAADLGYRDGKSDSVKGALEFTVMSFAAAMATAKHRPDFFKANVQFRTFISWQARRAMKIFRAGYRRPEFSGFDQERYLADFQRGPDAQAMRNFIENVWGKAYLEEVVLASS